jgi:CRISP-associated protein Cas1
MSRELHRGARSRIFRPAAQRRAPLRLGIDGRYPAVCSSHPALPRRAPLQELGRRLSRAAAGRRHDNGGAFRPSVQRAVGHHRQARPAGGIGRRGGAHPSEKGRPARDGSAWDADAVQVCAQVLLLREHGYTVEYGELFYAETRQRVLVEITPELVARTKSLAVQARALAIQPVAPPPLQSSPKCARCSLVGICLPDEINVLSGRQESPPRRLMAADPDAVPLYVTEPGSVIGIDGGRLTVTKYRELMASVRLIDVHHVCVYGNVQVTAQAMRELFSRDVDVFHFTGGGWLLGLTTGLPSKNVMLRIRQVTASAEGQLGAARQMIAGKIRNCRVLLRRNGGEEVARRVGQLAALAAHAERVNDAASLLGIEGSAARLYFEAFPSLLSGADALPGPPFTGLRNRRPPTDAVNCLLSFCYGLLAKETLAGCLAVGFDPYVGLLHRPRFGRPALALDLAEEFRPLLADSVVLTMINRKEISASDFVIRAGAVSLTADGRKTVIRAWERRMGSEVRHSKFGYEVTYRRAVEVQARILAAHLLGELPSYEPLVTR